MSVSFGLGAMKIKQTEGNKEPSVKKLCETSLSSAALRLEKVYYFSLSVILRFFQPQWRREAEVAQRD
jgi:hypothetical protein